MKLKAFLFKIAIRTVDVFLWATFVLGDLVKSKIRRSAP